MVGALIGTYAARCLASACVVAALAQPAFSQATQQISVTSAGEDAHGLNLMEAPNAVSDDGTKFVFTNYSRYYCSLGLCAGAANLPSADTADHHVYLRDISAGTTRLISQHNGQAGDRGSNWATISADGRFAAFTSYATNFPEATGLAQAYVANLDTGEIELVSRNSEADGGSVANDSTQYPTISADGRFVAFQSNASNLGHSGIKNRLYVYDRTEKKLRSFDRFQGYSWYTSLSISADGNSVAYRGCEYDEWDDTDYCGIFIWDATVGDIPVAYDVYGKNSNPFISGNGRFVGFTSENSNLTPGDVNRYKDAFIFDKEATTDKFSLVSRGKDGQQGDGVSELASISFDGRFVNFISSAGNLVENDDNRQSDVFVVDRSTNSIARVNVSSSGEQANGYSQANGGQSYSSGISPSGRHVVFNSIATNLSATDSGPLEDYEQDVFHHDRGPQGKLISFFFFERPIDNWPVWNSVKAGQTIPVKWQLADENGDFIRDVGAVKSIKHSALDTCEGQDTSYVNSVDTISGGSGLRYDVKDEHFVYNWVTEKSMANKCILMILTLSDNQEHYARFIMK